MTVSELIKALADFSPSSEVRVKPSIDSCGDKITDVYGVDSRSINQGKVVFILRDTPECEHHDRS
jgi:hypothetical protein